MDESGELITSKVTPDRQNSHFLPHSSLYGTHICIYMLVNVVQKRQKKGGGILEEGK